MAGRERIEADIIAQPPIVQANIKTRAPRIESNIVTAGGLPSQSGNSGKFLTTQTHFAADIEQYKRIYRHE